MNDTKSREYRKAMLGAMCYIARGLNPQVHKVIGIATEKTIQPLCSYDFCLIDKPNWTDKDVKEVTKLQSETGIFANLKMEKVFEDEYPQKHE